MTGPDQNALRSAQTRASNPKASAWVSANAGSGKTHVLTLRVLRLLIEGVDPARILCLTFTKAAAANMAARVFKTLAKWTALDDDALAQALAEIGAKPEPQTLARGRKLFARTIETPGGLKIQTIHAFCERLLHQFPFEANVPAGFRVLEEREADDLMREARARAFTDAEPELAAAIERIAAKAGAGGFDALIAETLKKRADIAAYGGHEAYRERLRARLGLKPGETEAELERAMREDGGGPGRWRQWAKALNAGVKTDKERATLLEGAAHMGADPRAQLAVYLDAFFTQKGPPRKILLTKGVAEKFRDFGDQLYDEQARLERLREKLRDAEALARSVDLMRVAETTMGEYARLENARGWLDFDDLVERALALIAKADAAWVLYKLDKGIEHILIDEAQDTSRVQWQILERLSEEMLAGRGRTSRPRTLFAVGDEKQSIFSFQGAAPAMFETMRREFARRHAAAELPFERVSLHLSFRSSPWILKAVDRVFSLEQAWRGVSAGEDKAPPHGAFHANLPGLVEIWAPIQPDPEPEPEDWRMPLDAASRSEPATVLAERIAGVIADWLSPTSLERVVGKDKTPRRIRAGDILVLVRSRGRFYEAMTRALRRRRIAFAGADRLKLRDHIAVNDLVSAGRAALCRDDDLALAEVLKSPLIGLCDDDLLEFAPRRAGSLAEALEASRFRAAAAAIGLWRERARKLAPFDFYARLLGADGGRRALIGRLGPEAADAIDEFLALAFRFERNESPSLAAFLDAVANDETALKRDMEAEAAEVRVMTVHAAKGLEAPIVFLPDTASAPTGRHDPKWLEIEPATPQRPALALWAAKREEDSPALGAAREAAARAEAGEHRRLLYVAMTRAAERLVVAAHEGASGRKQDCWYDLIRAGLEDALAPHPAPWPADTVWRFGAGPPSPPTAETAAAAPVAAPPAWLGLAAAEETAHAPTAPSRVAATPGSTPERRRRQEAGRLAHALLQLLPDLAPAARAEAAARYLAAHGAGLDAPTRESLAERALRLLADPDLAPLFGPNSRAEVAISGSLPQPGEPLAFSGRVDRLAVGAEAIDVVDFKSGSASGAARRAHVAQLALYRAALAEIYRRPVRAWLVWLETGAKERLQAIDLDAALDEVRRKEKEAASRTTHSP
ncbi:MAG: double-strand break repair helicase AddA [Roseiarcus sp.]